MTLFLGLVVGGIYQGVGNDASKALFNFGFCFTVTIAFMYNPLMPVLLQCKLTPIDTVDDQSNVCRVHLIAISSFYFSFFLSALFFFFCCRSIIVPTEVQLLKREHFNRWYRIGPYYLSMIASKLPIQIGLAIFYITMIYTVSNQPLELNRMAMFYSISIMIALTSESLGVLIASRLSLIVSKQVTSINVIRVAITAHVTFPIIYSFSF